MKSYRYSSWDGTQDLSAVDADDLMDAMADELMSHGDLNQALRNLMRRGMRGNMGSGFEGIRELMERLKQQSRERLERYNLASLIDELKQRLEDILQMERASLDPQQAAGQQGTAGQEGESGTDAPEHDGETINRVGRQTPRVGQTTNRKVGAIRLRHAVDHEEERVFQRHWRFRKHTIVDKCTRFESGLAPKLFRLNGRGFGL